MRKFEPSVLFFAAIWPTLLTFTYFVLLAEAAPFLQQGAYVAGKSVQFLLPLVWIALLCREPWVLRWFTRRGLGEGIAFGLAVFLAMLALHIAFLRGGPLGPDSVAWGIIRAKIAGFQLESPVRFLLLGVFYSLLHSGLEEYYWRWFVFRRLAPRLGFSRAMLLSSAAFMAHHVVLLGTYFGYGSFLTWFGSFGVAVGGAYWCWSYRRFDSIWPAWISHGIIDAAIFAIGFDLLFVS